MGLFDKIKNLLFEEEVIEIDKEETIAEDSKVEDIEDPKLKKQKEEVDEIEDVISERELFQSETTFKFPVIFDEEDFMVEKKNNVNPNVLDYEASKLKEKKPQEEKKKFNVSPIISPVYGIIDEEYKRERSQRYKEEKGKAKSKQVINFDVVREKAYGSLSNDIVDALDEEDNKGMFFNLKEEEAKIDESNLLFDMSETAEQPNEEELTVQEFSVDDLETDFIETEEEEKEEKEFKLNPTDNLFDLIDSMYETEEDDL